MSRLRKAALIATAAFLSATLGTAAVGVASSSPDEVDSEPVGSLFPPYYDGIHVLNEEITMAMEDYADIYAGLRFDDPRRTMVVGLNETAAPERVAEAKRVLDSIPAQHGLTIVSEPKDFALQERQALADEIFRDRDAWAANLGVEINATLVDPETGQVIVGTPDAVPSEGVSRRSNGEQLLISRVEFKPHAGNRKNDDGVWTGGDWMSFLPSASSVGNADCTSGFNWRRHADGRTYAGFAYHCYTQTGFSRWYHNGRTFGDLAWSASTVDAALLRSPGPGYSPTVWVGPANTATERIVGTSGRPTIGSAVALSGANSGLHTGTIVYTNVNVADAGPLAVTNTLACVNGDSGAPWLTTLSTPPYKAVAQGQHVGEIEVTATGYTGCGYLPVHIISEALGAVPIIG